MPQATTPPTSSVAIEPRPDGVAIRGALDIRTLQDAQRALASWRKRKAGVIDLAGLERLDTPGARLLCTLRDRDIELVGLRKEHAALLDLVCGLPVKPLPAPPDVPRWLKVIIDLGKAADEFARDAYDVVAFVGRAASATGHALVHPRELRLPSISRQVSETGVDALPIIGLLAVMISVVIAYQGVA